MADTDNKHETKTDNTKQDASNTDNNKNNDKKNNYDGQDYTWNNNPKIYTRTPNTTSANVVGSGLSKHFAENINGTTSVMTDDNAASLLGLDQGAFTTDRAQVNAQKMYDPSKAILEVKVPSAGKPLNNRDKYPVDLKIEELELHLPRIKKYKMPYDNGVSRAHAQAILEISDYAEKRIVKLENILATVMRYMFAIGTRMAVNCQYYGGQDHRSKYQCIRCLKDDRCADGMTMQLDQCLSCSRYEPIIGQTYDILNKVGANLSAIQDDLQAGYMNMEDYLNYTRVDKMHKPKTDYVVATENLTKRNANETWLWEEWDDGITMDWHLTPVEIQKPQINWRQDINHADRSPKKLASYQPANGMGANGLTPTNTFQPGNLGSSIKGHYEFMQKVLNGESGYTDSNNNSSGDSSDDKKDVTTWASVKTAIQNGFNLGEANANAALDNLNTYGYEQAMQNQCSTAKIDPLMMMALSAVESKGNPKADDGSNGGLFMTAGTKGTSEIKDQISAGIKAYQERATKYGKGSNAIGPAQGYDKWFTSLDSVNKDDSKFDRDWVGAMSKDGASEENLRYFPAVVKAYMVIQDANTGLSPLSNDNGGASYSFPLVTSKLAETYYIQRFGMSNENGGVISVSNAMVFKLPAGSEIHAPFDASSYDHGYDEKIGNFISMKDGNGATLIYGGLNSFCVENAEGIKNNTVIAVSSEKFSIQYLDSKGNYDDPVKLFPLASAISISDEKTVGAQIEESNKTAQVD